MKNIYIFGDSIAYGKRDPEGGWATRLRKYVDSTYNIPKTMVHVYNLGVPGDLAVELAKRFEVELKNRISDVKENLVLIEIGVNDSNPHNKRRGAATSEQDFKEALISIINIAQRLHVAIAFIGLLPIQENERTSTTENVVLFDSYITTVCTEHRVPKLELFQEFSQENVAELLLDWVHPSAKGHEILFNKILSFLKEQRLLESLVG